MLSGLKLYSEMNFGLYEPGHWSGRLFGVVSLADDLALSL